MNENLTPRLKDLLKKARKRASEIKNNYIGTEHAFLVWLEGTNFGTGIEHLKKTGVAFDKIREMILKAILPEKDKEADITQVLDFNAELANAIKEAKTIADNLNLGYTGIECFIIAILNDEESLVHKTLSSLSVTVTDVTKSLKDELTSPKASEPTKVPSGPAAEDSSGRGEKDSMLRKFSIELVERASKGELDPVIGRTKEVARTIRILARKKKNNPVLVGPAGVGKTSVVEGLALRIFEKSVPPAIQDKRIFALDLGRLIAGTVYRGQFEERLKKIMEEVKANKNYIVFIDELHTVIGAGGAEGSMDASNMIKPALARGDFNCIGATTLDEYRKYIEKDSALERRFQSVDVEEPNAQDTLLILKGAAKSYEKYHGIKYGTGVLEAIVDLSTRFITDRNQPDKSFDIMDEIGAAVKLAAGQSAERRELEERLTEVKKLKAQTIKDERFEEAGKLKEEEARLEFNINKAKESEKTKKTVAKLSDVYEVVANWTGIPVGEMNKTDKEKLLNLPTTLKEVVIGQDEAIDLVSKSVKKYKTPLKDTKRPIGGFLFVGPTGTGKSLLAETLAVKQFGTNKCYLELDMSEYSDSNAGTKLIGSPPGYVGYEEGGTLTKFVSQNPYSVILFDEIEKAHPQVRLLLLQILEKGTLTDNKGKVVSFKNTIIILTSNAAVNAAKSMGFATSSGTIANIKSNIEAELKAVFSPELVGRLEVVVFQKLNQDNSRKVVALEIGKLNTRLIPSKVRIEHTVEALDFILNRSSDSTFGARYVRHQVEHLIEDALTDDFLKENIPENSVIVFRAENNSLAYTIKHNSYEHTTSGISSLATS